MLTLKAKKILSDIEALKDAFKASKKAYVLEYASKKVQRASAEEILADFATKSMKEIVHSYDLPATSKATFLECKSYARKAYDLVIDLLHQADLAIYKLSSFESSDICDFFQKSHSELLAHDFTDDEVEAFAKAFSTSYHTMLEVAFKEKEVDRDLFFQNAIFVDFETKTLEDLLDSAYDYALEYTESAGALECVGREDLLECTRDRIKDALED